MEKKDKYLRKKFYDSRPFRNSLLRQTLESRTPGASKAIVDFALAQGYSPTKDKVAYDQQVARLRESFEAGRLTVEKLTSWTHEKLLNS